MDRRDLLAGAWRRPLEPLQGLRLRRIGGAPIAAGALAGVRPLKCEPGEPRLAYQVTLDGVSMLLKVQILAHLARRVGATLGRSYLRHERRMLSHAAGRGLSVPAVLGGGGRRRLGLVCVEGLLLGWFDDRSTLRDRVRDAASAGDRRTIDLGRDLLAHVVRRVRAAGLADKDLGAHNLLVGAAGPPGDAVWVDLERAVCAPADDAPATAQTIASALASWLVATRGDPAEVGRLFADLRDLVPEPAGGWDRLIKPIDRFMAGRTATLVQRGWLERVAAPICH